MAYDLVEESLTLILLDICLQTQVFAGQVVR